MAQLPISADDASKEIKALIEEKGLDTITSKIIRKHLEARFNCPLEEFKEEIDECIESCISEMNFAESVSCDQNNPKEEDDESSDLSDDFASGPKSEKVALSSTRKRKAEESNKSFQSVELTVDDDMASVIKRRRSANQVVSKRREQKPKDDVKKKGGRKKNTAFSKICVLSPELSSLLGKNYMRRSDVVKAMWEYFRSNNLMDARNKQYAILDEPLKRIFGQKMRVKAFGMMSELKKHVKDVALLDDTVRAKAEADIAEILAKEEEEQDKIEEVEDAMASQASEPTHSSELNAEKENSVSNSSYSGEDVVQSIDSSMGESQPSTSNTNQPSVNERNIAESSSTSDSEESDSDSSSNA